MPQGTGFVEALPGLTGLLTVTELCFNVLACVRQTCLSLLWVILERPAPNPKILLRLLQWLARVFLQGPVFRQEALLQADFRLADSRTRSYDSLKPGCSRTATVKRDICHQLILSVIAPCLNEEGNVDELVSRTLSVFNKLGINGQLMLVDDGSSDSTWTRIQGWSATDARVAGVRHLQNRGNCAVLANRLDCGVGKSNLLD